MKRVVLNKVDVTPDGPILLRFRKEEVTDGVVTSWEYHRTAVDPGVSLVDQMAAVNAHLKRIGWPEVAARDLSPAQTVVDREHTPTRVAAFQTVKEALRV